MTIAKLVKLVRDPRSGEPHLPGEGVTIISDTRNLDRTLVLRIINTMTYSRDVFAAPACYLAQRGGGCWDAKEKSVRNCAVSRGAA